jgi:NAD(P)-dependent dehydrogenase (short-subunit alcohol dehydrogenase family)
VARSSRAFAPGKITERRAPREIHAPSGDFAELAPAGEARSTPLWHGRPDAEGRSHPPSLPGAAQHATPQVTNAFLGQLRTTRGRIVNIGSVQSFMPVRRPNSPAYTTSKHSVLGFTAALTAELGKTPLNAQVRASHPGLGTRKQGVCPARTPLSRSHAHGPSRP